MQLGNKLGLDEAWGGEVRPAAFTEATGSEWEEITEVSGGKGVGV